MYVSDINDSMIERGIKCMREINAIGRNAAGTSPTKRGSAGGDRKGESLPLVTDRTFQTSDRLQSG